MSYTVPDRNDKFQAFKPVFKKQETRRRAMLEKLKNMLETNPAAKDIFQYNFLKTSDLIFSQSVRDLCEMNSCGMYGRSWACPPGVGTTEECKAKIMKYDHVFVFTTKHDIEDSYDFEGMMDGKARHEEICDALIPALIDILGEDILILSAEGCHRCSKCTYPDAPCRFPDTLHPSIESYGVEVNKIAKVAKINYINGANTVTYFGCIMY